MVVGFLMGALGLFLFLYGSGGGVFAEPPVFDTTPDPATRTVPENTPPGVNIGAPISATDGDEDGADNDDIEFGDTLTYSLSGTDAASFDIDSSTGQLITKAALDTETKASYSVTVTVKDSMANSVDQDVTITVSPVAEAPGALAAPTVVSTAPTAMTDPVTYSLKVIWYAPDDAGDGVTGYDVQYKKTTASSFTDDDHSGTGISTTIDGLEVDTSYQVRVRATGPTAGFTEGPWSISSVGSTNKKGNSLPTFTEADPVSRTVLENADPGLPVGFMVSATDTDNLIPLAYQLHGPDANSFDVQASTGQIRTKRGAVYNFEKKPTLNVTVTVSDGQGGSDARAVAINVTDVPEAPEAPARPTVRATEGSSRSLDVSWTEPDNMGPAITGYDIRYRKGNSGSFTVLTPTGTGTTATIAPTDDDLSDGDDRLTPGASYEVYVRAKSLEAPSGGGWSAAGTGRTSIGNSDPTFDDRPNLDRTAEGALVAASTDRTVAENTRAGQSVGGAVTAVDGNGDKRTYRLVAADAPDAAHVDLFDINESTGQILTKEPLNHEADCSDADGAKTGGDAENCTYTVKVQVWDGLDEHRNEQDTSSLDNTDDTDDGVIIDDEITVNITVSDVTEKPAAPTVTVTSSTVAIDATEAALTVTWDRPENMGPAITGYDVECTGDGITTANPCPQPTTLTLTDAVLTHSIPSLTPNKPYRVRVRAENAEGKGAWSIWVTQSTSKKGNTLPVFNDATLAIATVYVVENADSARQPVTSDDTGATVVSLGTTPGDGDTITLRLDGPGASRFSIDSTGQIRTTSKLNHEAPECGYDNTANPTSCSYTVRVKASDTNGGSAFHALFITVTDKDEPPARPAAPRVTATPGSGWSLQVTWNEPRNDGPPITDYDIQYRKVGETVWQVWPPTATTNADRSAKITTIPSDLAVPTSTQVHLEPSTRYEVQVRAKNGEGDDTPNWSRSGQGSTGASNSRPVFDSDLPPVVILEVEENTRAGQNVGNAIEATDPDKHRLTYSLEGPGKDSFNITNTGQIRTRLPLNHEERDEYSLTVKVNDGQRKNNSIAAKSVTIEVTDRPEQPSAPAAPKVAGIPGSTDSVRVTWSAPANPGPAITHYSVQYAVSGSRDAFLRVTVPTGSADRSAIITGLTSGTRYDVQVRAESPEGHSDWSRSSTGSPNPDAENRNPAFSNRSHTFSVAENTSPGIDVGGLVTALDPDGDTLTYALEGTDADSFDIIVTNGAGQIQTKAELNFERKSSYSVAVRARDGRGGTDAVNVTIRVTDVNTEAPDTPFAPTVTAISSTSLQLNWEAPANTGPPITDYDYRYREPGGTWTAVANTTITATTATITGLKASTSYDLEVRAKNAEGTSEWSNPGIGATNAAGANNPPVFSQGSSTTRSVSASSPSGSSIGAAVMATDADSDDRLTYSLEGRDAANFDIDTGSGQLRTKSGVTLIAGETYTVTVVADDGTDTAPITVLIEATAEPPNNPPVFAQGTSTSLSVVINARAGTNIGQPFRATDADTGDTVTYSLEGTDAASFDINGSTGQVRTKAGVTLEDKTYNVTVKAADQKGANTILAVTIEIDDRDGSVSLSPLSLQDGDQVTATLTDPDGDVTGVTWVWASSPNGTSGWTDISGATSATYTAATTDVGRHLRATASYTDAVGPGKSASAVTVAAVAADDDGSVTLSPSSLSDGETVTATLSDPDGGVTGVTWQWEFSRDRSNWTDIPGATSATYTPVTADVGSYLRATARYTDAVGPNKSAEGVTAGVVTADDDGSVTLSNTTPTDGETVTATLNDPDGRVSGATWQWSISSDRTTWTVILNATSSSYTATTANVGSYLRASVSYTDAVGPGKSANAVTAAAVAPDDDGVVTLSTRAPEVGSAITASLSDPDGGVTGETWQWAKSSNGATGWTDIQDATSASYTPGRSDTGVFLRATVSYNDAVGPGKSAQAATSSGVVQAALLSEYDANSDGRIERSEAIQAVSDFFNGEISKGDVLDVLVLYFSS